MSLIGFDIGNNSCVTAIAKPRTIQIVLNDEAQYETPSVVSFAEKKRHFGSSAASLNVTNPSSTLSQIKRLVGKQYSNIKAELQELPFATSEAEDGGILVHVDHWGATQKFTVIQVLAMLMSHLKKGSEKNLESPVTSCVIGVPSYFTDRERFAYLDAAEIAGLKPLKLMHEGTAVALGYGIYKTDLERETIVVFIDIGHCHTQVTVVLFEKGGLHVLSHAYDQNLGGRDFDKILVQYFSNQFRDKYHIDIYAANPRVRTRLMSSCEKLKKVLTSNTEARLSIECLVNDIDVSGVIKREEFERLSSELLFRLPVSCNKALTDVNLDPSKVHIVELVGSGSRIPAISSILTGYFGENKLKRTLNSSECVARGCALQCSMLAPNSTISNVYKIQDSLPLHVEYTIDNSVSTSSKMLIFPKGDRFPISGEIKFWNLFDTFHLKLSSGIQHGVSNCPSQESQPTRTFKVGPFPEDMYYIPIGRLQISFDDHGCVSVGSAWVEACGLQGQHLNLQIVETLSTRMSESGISNAQSSEMQLSSQDKLIEEIQEKRNVLESFIYNTRKKLVEKYRSYVRDSEKSIIYKSLEETERWLDGEGEDESLEVYSYKFHELEKIFDPIVKRYEDIEAAVNETRKLRECITMQRQAASSLHGPKKHAIIRECDRAEEYLNAAKKVIEMTPKCIDQLPMPDVIKSMINSFNMFCEEINNGNRLNSENRQANNDNIFVKFEKGVQYSVTNYTDCTSRATLAMHSSSARTVSKEGGALLSDDILIQQGKNEKEKLEAYISYILSELLGRYGSFASDLEKEHINSKLEQLMKGIYGSGNDKIDTDYLDIFTGLKELLSPIEDRFTEEEARAPVIQDFLYCIFRNRVAAIFQACRKKKLVNSECNKAEQWLTEKREQQDLSPKYANAVLRAKEIIHEMDKLDKSCDDILSPNWWRPKLKDNNNTKDFVTTAKRNANPSSTTVEKKRALEIYFQEIEKYIVRYSSYASEVEEATLRSTMHTVQSLLTEDCDDKHGLLYDCQLAELKKIVYPIKLRYKDEDLRERASRELKSSIFSHKLDLITMPSMQRKRVEEECNIAEKWLNEKAKIQNSLPKYTDPAVWSDQINKKKDELNAAFEYHCPYNTETFKAKETQSSQRPSYHPQHESMEMNIQNRSREQARHLGKCLLNYASTSNPKSHCNKFQPLEWLDDEGMKINAKDGQVSLEVGNLSKRNVLSSNDKVESQAKKSRLSSFSKF